MVERRHLVEGEEVQQHPQDVLELRPVLATIAVVGGSAKQAQDFVDERKVALLVEGLLSLLEIGLHLLLAQKFLWIYEGHLMEGCFDGLRGLEFRAVDYQVDCLQVVELTQPDAQVVEVREFVHKRVHLRDLFR